MLAKKNLQDLFVQGVEKEFTDGDESVTFYFKKLNSFESETAFKKANAVRARVLSAKFADDDDEEKLAYYAEVYDLSDDLADIVDLIIADKMSDIYLKIEQRISEDEKWKNDNRLQGLLDAWKDGLSDEYALEKTEESVKVFEELQEFSNEVQKVAEAEINVEKRDLLKRSLKSLQDELVNKLIEIEANRKWVIEYNKWELYFATREVEDHSKKVFESREFLDELDDSFIAQLLNAYKSILVDDVSLKF